MALATEAAGSDIGLARARRMSASVAGSHVQLAGLHRTEMHMGLRS